MARSRRFPRLADDIGRKVHDFDRDIFAVILVSRRPVGNGEDLAELPDGNGYARGGKAVERSTWTQSGGVGTLRGDEVGWTADGTLGPIAAAVLVNASASKIPLCYWESGLPIVLEDGDTFSVPFVAREILSIG